MAARAAINIIPIALCAALVIGAATGAGPFGLLALYSGIGQAALFGLLALSAVPAWPNCR